MKLRADPDAIFHGIVAVAGDPSRCAIQARALGLTVHRTLSLVPGLALSGPARAFLVLHGQDWALKIEEDRRLRAV